MGDDSFVTFDKCIQSNTSLEPTLVISVNIISSSETKTS